MRCREDISGVNAFIRFATLPSVVERESQEGRHVADFGRFRPISHLKLVVMATSLDRSRNQYQIEHLQRQCHMSTNPENLVKIGLVVSKISLLQAIVKNSSITYAT